MAEVNPNLAPAAQHYAEAMCPANDAACIDRVAAGWERDVDRSFGVLSSQPPQVMRFDVHARNGQKAGTLTYADGTVTLCYEAGGGKPAKCGVVGTGLDGFTTAANMLGVQGYGVERSA